MYYVPCHQLVNKIMHHLITLAQLQMHVYLYVCSAYLPLRVHADVMWCQNLHECYKMEFCTSTVTVKSLTVIQSDCLSSLLYRTLK